MSAAKQTHLTGLVAGLSGVVVYSRPPWTTPCPHPPPGAWTPGPRARQGGYAHRSPALRAPRGQLRCPPWACLPMSKAQGIRGREPALRRGLGAPLFCFPERKGIGVRSAPRPEGQVGRGRGGGSAPQAPSSLLTRRVSAWIVGRSPTTQPATPV